MKNVMRLIVSIFILFVIFANVALAKEWTATKVFQPAQYSMDGKSWENITAGMVMPSASWIQTGKRGRIILNRGKEMIQFKPNTMASISKANPSGSKTLVKQQFGSLLLDVETKNHKHLKVETPFLAAVVKGTRFAVDVVGNSARLSVHRGTVEVTDERRGEKVDVSSFQTVSVAEKAQNTLSVMGFGRIAKVVKVKPATPKLKSLSNNAVSKKFSEVFGPKKNFVENIRAQFNVQREKLRNQIGNPKSSNLDLAKAFGIPINRIKRARFNAHREIIDTQVGNAKSGHFGWARAFGISKNKNSPKSKSTGKWSGRDKSGKLGNKNSKGKSSSGVKSSKGNSKASGHSSGKSSRTSNRGHSKSGGHSGGKSSRSGNSSHGKSSGHSGGKSSRSSNSDHGKSSSHSGGKSSRSSNSGNSNSGGHSSGNSSRSGNSSNSKSGGHSGGKGKNK